MPKQILFIQQDNKDAAATRSYPWHSEISPVFTCPDKVAEALTQKQWDIIAADISGGNQMIRDLISVKSRFPRTQLVILSPPKYLNAAMDELGLHATAFHETPVSPRILEFSFLQALRTISRDQKINRYSERIAQLHNAQDLLDQLFEEVPCFISVQDRSLMVTAANRLYRNHFGVPLSGRCYEMFKHRDAPCGDCPVLKTFDDGQSHMIEEVVTSMAGQQYNVLTQTAPIRNELGQITQVMEMSTDITQIRQLQDHLISMGLMLGSVSHGVKGMLTALDGGIYQLETGILQKNENRIEKAYDQIHQVAEKIKKMVLEILYYAKSRELNYERLDIAELAENVVETVKPMAQKNEISLSISIPSTLGKIEVDSNWMESSLVNFLENALDACLLDRKEKKHWIRFSVKKQSPGFILFTIEDNGIGMDEETKNKIFTLFFSSKGSQGTGLGLYIAHQVIKFHGGQIEVTSRKGIGSRFDICLPFEKPDEDLNAEDELVEVISR